jgi:hypothetical protein
MWILLSLLCFIVSTGASPCIFTRNIRANGVQQQLQVESWGADSIRIRLSPDVIIQNPDYQAQYPIYAQ